MPWHCPRSGGQSHCKCSLHIHHSCSAMPLMSSEIAQNAGEHLVAGLEAAISQDNLAIPWWWSYVSVQASTNVYEWILAVFANLSVEEVLIKWAQTICKPINIPFLKIQTQSMVSKPICNVTIQHIQKNDCNQYPIIYIYINLHTMEIWHFS